MSRKATTFDRKLGARVREERLAISISQTRLAEYLGVSFQQVQKYEKGINRMSVETALDVADALGIPFEKLIKGMRK